MRCIIVLLLVASVHLVVGHWDVIGIRFHNQKQWIVRVDLPDTRTVASVDSLTALPNSVFLDSYLMAYDPSREMIFSQLGNQIMQMCIKNASYENITAYDASNVQLQSLEFDIGIKQLFGLFATKSGNSTATIQQISATGLTLVSDVPGLFQGTAFTSYCPVGHIFFVAASNSISNQTVLSRFNTQTGAMLSSETLPFEVNGLVFNSSVPALYATYSDRFALLDINTGSLLKILAEVPTTMFQANPKVNCALGPDSVICEGIIPPHHDSFISVNVNSGLYAVYNSSVKLDSFRSYHPPLPAA